MFNVGSGRPKTVLEVAETLANVLGIEGIDQKSLNSFVSANIRHCFADIALAEQILGYSPRVRFEDGLGSVWPSGLRSKQAVDNSGLARDELATRGLVFLS